MPETQPPPSRPSYLPEVAREVEEFVASGGWDQPPQLFALVPTAHLLEAQPELAGQVDPAAELTPIAQEELPKDKDLGEALAEIMWPDVVRGCALAQEIVVLPPEAEDEVAAAGADEDQADLAAKHPLRREARLIAAVLRDGSHSCVLRLRGAEDGTGEDEVVEHPELAPNLTDALVDTLR